MAGRLRAARARAVQRGAVRRRRGRGGGELPEKYLGLYAHANVWPDDDPGLQERARAYMAACRELAERMLGPVYAKACR